LRTNRANPNAAITLVENGDAELRNK